LPEGGLTADERNPTPAEQKDDPISHEKYALCMHQIPTDLKFVIERWCDLPKLVRQGILAMVLATFQK